MKTLVTAKHEHGPAVNGHDGCSARWAEGGMCPGVKTARWLNSLGDDAAPYASTRVTNGTVRDNWLRECDHIVAADPQKAALAASVRDLRARLAVARRRLLQTERELQS